MTTTDTPADINPTRRDVTSSRPGRIPSSGQPHTEIVKLTAW